MGGMISSVGNLFGMIATEGKEKKADKMEKKAAEEAKRARELEAKEAEVRNRKEQIQQLAQARVLRAQIRAGAAAAGVGGSSGPEGGSGSVMSQAARNVGFISQLQSINADRFQAIENQTRFISKASNIRKRAAKYRAYNQAFADIGAAVTSFGMSSGSGYQKPPTQTGSGGPTSGGQSMGPFSFSSNSWNSGQRF